jgi:hypothetical protein
VNPWEERPRRRGYSLRVKFARIPELQADHAQAVKDHAANNREVAREDARFPPGYRQTDRADDDDPLNSHDRPEREAVSVTQPRRVRKSERGQRPRYGWLQI